MTQSPHILIICAQCDGEDVGESWCGYEWVKRIARRFEVTVLTQRFPGHSPPSQQLQGVRIIEWDATPFLSHYPRFNSAVKPWYPLFYLRARRWIRQALANGEHFDIAHHLTPMAMRYPSPCAGMGLPYVIGPIAGSVETPDGFRGELTTQPGFMNLRELDALRLRFDPQMRRSYESADVVVCSAPYVARRLEGMNLRRVTFESEVGIKRVQHSLPRPEAEAGTLRMLHVGRIIRTKGLRDCIRAMALLADLPQVTLMVAGAGEDLEPCRVEAERLGVASRVQFLGRLSRAQIEALYSTADLFLFPSFREATGIVLFEAMRHGLPIIAADNGGPGHIIDDSCGLRITPGDPQQFARDIAAGIRFMALNPDVRRRMGDQALTRCLDMALWENKIERLAGIYRDVCGQSVKAAVGGRSGLCQDTAA